ncbi:cell division protein FtsA [Prosthecochloris sp. SCSIO W1102]|uniref:cell division protein FtsA n=1 Tax=Prosthecochloris sp. SCSIO W1102 TaxID=2992243 RepID=UPI00223CD62D|nr:cell division protein FtsA [Prosthecochloris sp. SCSIO W1102]UZJ39420.1 cell division protein FtsA [Prosthecochloris sp. SCSIO W1102]
MQKSNIVVGLDIGTTKVCVVVAEKDEVGKLNILGKGRTDSEGLQRATVVNINKTVDAIKSAVADAERESSIRIKGVNVGISGAHVHCINSNSEISVNQSGVVNASDVKRFLEKAKTNIRYLDIDHEIIHVIPQEFIVDDQEGVLDPIGMAGTTMRGSAYIVVGMKTKIRNIKQCVEKAGLEVNAMTFEPIASGLAVMKKSEKKSGVVIIDIGGGTTEVAIYIDGAIRFSEVIKVAANDVTHDVAYGVKALYEVAEELKIKHGFAYSKERIEDEEILIDGIEGRPCKSFMKSSLTLIIEARMMEIFELIREAVKRSGYFEYLNAGAVITGGGSLMPGTDTLASNILGLDVRTGFPEGVSGGIKGAINNPIYATVMGLVAYSFENSDFQDSDVIDLRDGQTEPVDAEESHPEGETGRKIVDRLKDWWEKL